MAAGRALLAALLIALMAIGSILLWLLMHVRRWGGDFWSSDLGLRFDPYRLTFRLGRIEVAKDTLRIPVLRGREFTEFMPDHLLRDEDRDVNLAVVHGYCVTNHAREDRRCPCPPPGCRYRRFR